MSVSAYIWQTFIIIYFLGGKWVKVFVMTGYPEEDFYAFH
jgi:hypothetical protein